MIELDYVITEKRMIECRREYNRNVISVYQTLTQLIDSETEYHDQDSRSFFIAIATLMSPRYVQAATELINMRNEVTDLNTDLNIDEGVQCEEHTVQD